MTTDQENAENIENTENISEDSKLDKAKKEDNFFRDKLLIPIGATVIAGFIASYLSNYLTKQASYNDLVDKYTARLKEIVVSDKLNSLRSETGELKTDIAYLVNKKTEDTIDLDKLNISRKTLIDEFLLPKNTESNEPEPEKIQIESILKFVQDRSAQKNKELAQIRGLMNTITVNTLISLSEDDAFVPGFSSTFLSFIPFFKSRNIERRDIIINALRLSELGIGNRIDGDATFPFFLENTKIGGYSLQTGAVINLKKMDLTLGYLNSSTFSQVNLEGANFNGAYLNPSTNLSTNHPAGSSIFSESILNNVNFAGTGMENVRFINSSVQNSTFDDSFLKGLQAVSADSNRICARLFLGITVTSKGINCNKVDFSGSSFMNSNLSDSNFTNSILVGVNLTNANLTNANFTNANLTNANFTNANLTNVNLTNADLSSVKGFKLDNQKTLKDIDKQKTLKDIMKIAEQNNIRLCNTRFSYSEENGINTILFNWFQMLFKPRDNRFFVLFDNCKKANLSNKTLNLQQGKDISRIKWNEANMTNTIIQIPLNDKPNKNKQIIDQQFVKELFKGAKFCNTLFLLNSQAINYGLGFRISDNCKGENLSNKNLSDSVWTDVDLTHADLENSILDIKSLDKAKLCNTILPNGIKSFENCQDNKYLSFRDLRDLLPKQQLTGLNLAFTGADLSGADLSGADLSSANLTGVKLIKAKMNETFLSDADLSKTDLTKADLTKADLTKADLTKADLTKADLSGANLTKTKGLKLQQLEKAILCHTKLPAKLAAQNIENRDCPKK